MGKAPPRFAGWVGSSFVLPRVKPPVVQSGLGRGSRFADALFQSVPGILSRSTEASDATLASLDVATFTPTVAVLLLP
jgi:hypothetical protein